jgi:hypothetical protein
MSYPSLHRFRDFTVTLQTTSVGGTPVACYNTVPWRGTIMKIIATTQGSITTADATVAFALNGSANTAGNVVIPLAGAASGQSVVQPVTSPIYVSDGDVITLTPSGASGASIGCVFIVAIRETL